ncbi:hypothetical protein EJ04DRAFT_578317 [Polyplosphaeria fusca]|uniref:Gfd2/YDR514C-like C-terminal domain-containing protein n=1 Tax=Polyplosphaeria fusca TaxID=682080 RepID=A0A9P4QRP5_9PLEO|nr:hypothetical protein EJ04DRAFT_578317 [Polyplosphaeria fusca]
MSSRNSIRSSSSSSPETWTEAKTVLTPLEEVRQYFSKLSDTEVLRHVLGFPSDGAPELAKHAIINAIDIEAYCFDQSKLTEVGLAVLTAPELAGIAAANPGPHAKNVLKQIYNYHYRLRENAHLVNNASFLKGNPEKNHFGETRFLSAIQMNNALKNAFCWPVDENKPELGFCPVVILGHAVRGDFNMLRNGIGFDAEEYDTVVRTIDTQQIADENCVASEALVKSGNRIGLARLASYYNSALRDQHNASNDIAYTMITAVLMGLGREIYGGHIPQARGKKTMQEVVNGLEIWSKSKSPSSFGVKKFCTRCDGNGHL